MFMNAGPRYLFLFLALPSPRLWLSLSREAKLAPSLSFHWQSNIVLSPTVFWELFLKKGLLIVLCCFYYLLYLFLHCFNSIKVLLHFNHCLLYVFSKK